ncbi:MAG: hypothetical protein N6V49_01200 [Serratia symbiotica]|nr:hypothetical protein [Serratia symbiotica]
MARLLVFDAPGVAQALYHGSKAFKIIFIIIFMGGAMLTSDLLKLI